MRGNHGRNPPVSPGTAAMDTAANWDYSVIAPQRGCLELRAGFQDKCPHAGETDPCSALLFLPVSGPIAALTKTA